MNPRATANPTESGDRYGGDITETFGASAGEQTKVSHGKKRYGEFGPSYGYHMV